MVTAIVAVILLVFFQPIEFRFPAARTLGTRGWSSTSRAARIVAVSPDGGSYTLKDASLDPDTNEVKLAMTFWQYLNFKMQFQYSN